MAENELIEKTTSILKNAIKELEDVGATSVESPRAAPVTPQLRASVDFRFVFLDLLNICTVFFCPMVTYF